MANVGRTAALAGEMLPTLLEGHLHRASARLNPRTDMILRLKLQRPGQGIGLGQPQPQTIPHGKAGMTAITYQNLGPLIEMETLITQG